MSRDFAPMQFNTALGFLASGLAVTSLARGKVWGAGSLGAVVSLIGVGSLFEILLAGPLGFPDLFVGGYAHARALTPGLMSAATAVSFLACGSMCVIAAFYPQSAWAAFYLVVVGAAVLAVAGVSLFSYAASLPVSGGLMGMAIHTAACFLLLAGSLAWGARQAIARRGIGRATYAMGATMVFSVAGVAFWQLLLDEDLRQRQRESGYKAAALGRVLEVHLASNLSALRRFAAEHALPSGRSEAARVRWARQYREGVPGLQALAFAGAGGHLDWVSEGQPAPSRSRFDLRRSWQDMSFQGNVKAQQACRYVVPARKIGKTDHLLGVCPVSDGSRWQGALVGVYSLPELLSLVMPGDEERYAGLVQSDGQPLYVWHPEDSVHDPRLAAMASFRVGTIPCTVELWPRSDWLRRSGSQLPVLVLGFFVVTGLLFAALWFLWLLSQERAQQLLAANRGLSAETKKRRAALSALELRTQELARSNEELKQFAYVASHDLQEPLRMVTTFAQLLKRELGDRLSDDAERHVGFIVDNARRLEQLVHGVLEYSNATRGQPRRRRVELTQVVEMAKRQVSEGLRACDAEVNVGTLPSLNVDPGQLASAFAQLIGNAIQFRSERPLKIAIDAKLDGGSWVLCVEDNGIGLDPLHCKRIFDMFQRMSRGEAGAGAGIGLAIVKAVVNAHGGEVWADGVVGQRACFYLSIPSVAVDMPAATISSGVPMPHNTGQV